MEAIRPGCQLATPGVTMKLAKLFSRSRFDDRAHDLYDTIMAQSRLPVFYGPIGVPDTVDGRFEMIVLHAALVTRRLRAAGEPGRDLGQALFDLMFADMDRSLRQMGVGDLRVGPRVKTMVKAFYGRAAAYDLALARPDDRRIAADAVRRNLFGTVAPDERQVALMTDYIGATFAALGEQSDEALLAGRVSFPGPERLDGASGN